MIVINDKMKIAAWSSYWSEGNTTSLPNLFAENYGGDVLRFWSEALNVLGDNSRALDICTGNGAIAILARENVNRRNISCEIHAIDIATIHPNRFQNNDTTHNAVKFHSGVAVEATPFPDNHFDLILGQFALEYCIVADAIKELARIARKDGTVVLMMHHAESATVRSTHETIDIAALFLEEPTIFYRLRKYAEHCSSKKNKDTPKAIQKRHQLMVSFDNANNLIKRHPNNHFLRVTIDKIRQFTEQVQNEPPVGISEIREFEKVVKHHLIRMKDQRNAALGCEQIAEVRALFDRHGFRKVRCQPYFLNEVLFSWALEARRGNGV